jgi:hypothetical protein
MTHALASIWRQLSSVRLTVVLCLLLTADLSVGYVCLDRRATLFAPLGDIGLATWMETYGRNNLAYTAWFFLLLALLGLFSIHTLVCTTQRLLLLTRARAHFSPRRMMFKLAPHVMHLALVVMLVGYLCSYLFAQVLVSRTLVPGASLTLPGTQARITLESFEPVYAPAGDRLAEFSNRVLRPKARLLLEQNNTRRTELLGFNQPIRFAGYGVFLKDFSPKKRGGMLSRVRIDMSIRKDPGVWGYLAGMLLFTVGLASYLVEWVVSKRGEKGSR